MNKLTLVPIGGLANRLYALTSAIAYCSEHHIPLRVEWFKDWGMGADFHSLFELSETVNRVQVFDAKWYDYLTLDKPRKKNFRIPAVWQKLAFDTCIYEKQIYSYTDPSQLMDDFRKGSSVYLIHLAQFYPCADIRGIIHPVHTIQQQIDERISRFPGYTVGVHIRRTDNTASIEHSPLHLFIRRMEEEISLHPDVCFYVASDSKKEKQELQKRFGDRIITSLKEVRRDMHQGIVDAVIELYALAATQKIYGSYRSSYSILAAELSNIKLIIP